MQKQSLWHNQNKFCRAWKCGRTSRVSCSWHRPVQPGPAAASSAARHCSCPPASAPGTTSAAASLRHTGPAASCWGRVGRVGELEGQFEECSTRGMSWRAPASAPSASRMKKHGKHPWGLRLRLLRKPAASTWAQAQGERSRESWKSDLAWERQVTWWRKGKAK